MSPLLQRKGVKYEKIMALAAIMALSACGGSDSVSNPSAEGIWSGTTTNGTVVNMAVLNNGETWGIYGTASSVVGAVYGNTTTSANALKGSGTAFNFVTHTATNGDYTGQFSEKASIDMTLSNGTQFKAAYDASYDQAATPATVAGTYKGTAQTAMLTQQNTAVVVDANGNVSSSISEGNQTCTTSGTAIARPGGKNVYDLKLTFTGNLCVLGNGTTVTGVATYKSATNQMVAMALKGDKTDGLMFIGTKN